MQINFLNIIGVLLLCNCNDISYQKASSHRMIDSTGIVELDDCDSILNKKVHQIIDAALDEESVKESRASEATIFVQLILDSFANVRSVEITDRYGLEHEQIELIKSKLVGSKLCLYNPDKHIPFKVFLRERKNKFFYLVQYPSTFYD